MPVRQKVKFAIALVTTLCFAAPIRATKPVGWKVGIARAKITPAKPMWMAGYGNRDHPSEGTLHDLWLKAVAIEGVDGGRAVIVTSDLLGFPKGVADPICLKSAHVVAWSARG